MMQSSNLTPFEQARRYLAEVPGAISGDNGHTQTFKVARVLVQDFDLSDEEALALLRAWNATCSPQWPEADLERKVREARKKMDPARIGGKVRGGARHTPRRTPVERWAALRCWKPEAITEMGGRNHSGVVAIPMFIDDQEVGVKQRKPDGSFFEFPGQEPHKSHTPKGQQLGLMLSMAMRSGTIPEDADVDLFEGEADCCAAVNAGAKYVLGLPGAKFKPDVMTCLQQLLAGKRGRVTMFPDPGEAGENCGRNVARALRAVGVDLRIAPPPGADDLDKRLRRENDKAAALHRWRDQAIPAFKIYGDEEQDQMQGRNSMAKMEKASSGDILILPGGEQPITASAERLFAGLASTSSYFLRGGRVATVSREGGALAIDYVTPEAMRSIPEKYYALFAWRSDGRGKPMLKPSTMTREQAAALLECSAREALPDLRGLSGCPLLLGDGRVIGPGFDPVSGIYVTGGAWPDDVPLEEAVEALLGIIGDVDFLSAGDRSRGIAALLTPALRLGGHLRHVPIDVAEADQSQSGKGYRQKLEAAIYGEELQPVTQRAQGGVGSLDESLAGRLHAGRPFIQLDNLRGKVDSPYLEAMLTADQAFPVRIPHRGEVMVDPSRFVILATSNAVEMTPDLANRSSIIRIRKRPEGYQFKRYAEGDVLDHVRARQSYYLGCVFAVIRAWIEAGRPQTGESRHDFRPWARTMDWIVQNIFKAAPLMDGHKEAKARVSDPGMTFVRAIAVAIDQSGDLGEGRSASEIYELAEANSIPIPGLREPDEKQGPRTVGKILGRFMGGKERAAVDDYEVEVESRRVARPDGSGYFDMKFYRFERTTSGARNSRSAVGAVDAVEDITLLGNDAISNKVCGSTAVNCGSKTDAQAVIDRLAVRGVTFKLDPEDRVVVVGSLSEDEHAKINQLHDQIRAVLKEETCGSFC